MDPFGRLAMSRSSAAMDLQVLDELVARLRAPDGCPWDREQTLGDLRAYLLEEAHEVADAIDRRDWDDLREEMGDLLFQLAFLGRLNDEAARFSIADSIECVRNKMVQRHPHVFGNEQQLADAEAVARSWERRKVERRSEGASLLDGVAASLPGLVASYRMTQKASGIGFDWSSPADVAAKVEEELQEVLQAASRGRKQRSEEIGDLLFAVANLARHLDVDPEAALAHANLKFRRRFRSIEKALAAQQRRLTEATPEEMEELWEQAKRAEAETSTRD
jgi:ATP diphosphatase